MAKPATPAKQEKPPKDPPPRPPHPMPPASPKMNYGNKDGIAILTDSRRRANDELKRLQANGKRVAKFDKSGRGEFEGGQKFFIATTIKQLHGRRITNYQVLGSPSMELVAYARTRIFDPEPLKE